MEKPALLRMRHVRGLFAHPPATSLALRRSARAELFHFMRPILSPSYDGPLFASPRHQLDETFFCIPPGTGPSETNGIALPKFTGNIKILCPN